MGLIHNILVPLYEKRDGCPAYDHAMCLAETLGARAQVGTIVDGAKFVEVAYGMPGTFVSAVNAEALEAFRGKSTRIAESLCRSANEGGGEAQVLVPRSRSPSP